MSHFKPLMVNALDLKSFPKNNKWIKYEIKRDDICHWVNICLAISDKMGQGAGRKTMKQFWFRSILSYKLVFSGNIQWMKQRGGKGGNHNGKHNISQTKLDFPSHFQLAEFFNQFLWECVSRAKRERGRDPFCLKGKGISPSLFPP